jgi:hypothetical protein
MTDWVRLCDVGDLKGKFTLGDLDRITTAYDPAFHECPLVAGVLRDDSESYGWIQSLKREGQSLYAKFKQFVPEIIQGLQHGLYKRHSVSFYNNLNGRGIYLRHVGFSPVAGVGGVPEVRMFLEDGFNSFTEFEFDFNQGEQMMSQEISAEKLLRNFLGVEFSEGSLDSKVRWARRRLVYNPSPQGRCMGSNSGVEETIAAEVLSELKSMDFGEALKQIRHFGQSA